MDSAQAYSLAQDTLYQKQVWESGDQSARDRAAAQAAANREQLRSNGYGWVSDLVDSNDTLGSAAGALGLIAAKLSGTGPAAPTNTGPAPNSSPTPYAPTPGGQPSQTNVLGNGQHGSQGQVSQLGQTLDPSTLAGKVAKGVTGAFSGLLNSLNGGLQAGAAGTGAAAGGVGQTVGTLLNYIMWPTAILLGIIGITKVLRLNLKVGGH